jgi:hypothetical protein
MPDTLDEFWTDVLSREPAQVRSAMRKLSVDERRSVIAHLRRMVVDAGWTDGQRDRARAALDTLDAAEPLDS